MKPGTARDRTKMGAQRDFGRVFDQVSRAVVVRLRGRGFGEDAARDAVQSAASERRFMEEFRQPQQGEDENGWKKRMTTYLFASALHDAIDAARSEENQPTASDVDDAWGSGARVDDALAQVEEEANRFDADAAMLRELVEALAALAERFCDALASSPGSGRICELPKRSSKSGPKVQRSRVRTEVCDPLRAVTEPLLALASEFREVVGAGDDLDKRAISLAHLCEYLELTRLHQRHGWVQEWTVPRAKIDRVTQLREAWETRKRDPKPWFGSKAWLAWLVQNFPELGERNPDPDEVWRSTMHAERQGRDLVHAALRAAGMTPKEWASAASNTRQRASRARRRTRSCQS